MPGSPESISRPRAAVIVAGSAPCSGDWGSATASAISWSRTAVPALCTAALIIIAPLEPTGEPVPGRLVSPNSTRTSRSSTPSASAATWVSTVGVPVPNSWVEVCTMAVPSA